MGLEDAYDILNLFESNDRGRVDRYRSYGSHSGIENYIKRFIKDKLISMVFGDMCYAPPDFPKIRFHSLSDALNVINRVDMIINENGLIDAKTYAGMVGYKGESTNKIYKNIANTKIVKTLTGYYIIWGEKNNEQTSKT